MSLSIRSGGVAQAVNPATGNANDLNLANFQCLSGAPWVFNSALSVSSVAGINLTFFYQMFPTAALLFNKGSGSVIESPGSTVGADLTMATNSRATDQFWTWTLTSTNQYAFISGSSGLALDTASSASGAAVVQNTYTGADSQLWVATFVDDTYFKITNPTTGYALTQSGSGLVAEAYTGSDSQLWSYTN